MEHKQTHRQKVTRFFSMLNRLVFKSRKSMSGNGGDITLMKYRKQNPNKFNVLPTKIVREVSRPSQLYSK